MFFVLPNGFYLSLLIITFCPQLLTESVLFVHLLNATSPQLLKLKFQIYLRLWFFFFSVVLGHYSALCLVQNQVANGAVWCGCQQPDTWFLSSEVCGKEFGNMILKLQGGASVSTMAAVVHRDWLQACGLLVLGDTNRMKVDCRVSRDWYFSFMTGM